MKSWHSGGKHVLMSGKFIKSQRMKIECKNFKFISLINLLCPEVTEQESVHFRGIFSFEKHTRQI